MPISPTLFTTQPPRNELLQVKVTAQEREAVRELAEHEGMSLSTFVRSLIAERLRAQSEESAAA